MRIALALCTLPLSLAVAPALAQSTTLASTRPVAPAAPAKLATYPLFVSEQKTTHLVFPSPVTYVDLGSAGLIAAKATGSENIVRVKAAGSGFSETNMTVLTASGKLYSFVVGYQRNPRQLGLDLGAPSAGPAKLPVLPLYVSDQKTTHLVFPYPVTYVDLGNSDILAAKATSADNIVRVKAASNHVTETNMTVLTSGGKLYMFVVNYQHDPKVLSLDLSTMTSSTAQAGSGSDAILSSTPIPQGNLDAYSKQALARGGAAASDTKNQLSVRAGSVGYQQETLFFPLHLRNRSNVTYDVDFVKFYIQDKKVAKRTAEQAIELTPTYVYNGNLKKIEAAGKLQQVFVFKKFTIPDQKNLVVEVYEKGGGRNIKLRLSNSDLLRARGFR
ncbi:conjugative transposon protein TraN [Hymenobacter sp. NST-14]|uniref:conjugative transposon protein TraN n=1 Tax=Hymenobacter piscis TaxID=2839984 RepID=UPI001C02597B|nr:conjugative transposon protein TraN [Hymenobacter piscis]MBT9395043.1 conjugative transposon protein TraN [Hymenobacter piscis]